VQEDGEGAAVSEASSADRELILRDDPRAGVRRLTLNRPGKRNALSNPLRAELYSQLEQADLDDEVRVIVLRGAGSCFSSGYDLAGNLMKGQPWHTARGDGNWSRHVVDGHFRVWDLRKPVIAQVHGYCLAGGSELAASCDLVYIAEDAQVGYPPVRLMSPPDMQFHPWMVGMRAAMELMLTGDAISGIEAARMGFANRAYPLDELEGAVLDIAERVAKVPTDLQQLNKRSVHRAMEIMGMRTALRAGTEIQSLGFHQKASREYLISLTRGVTDALDRRDEAFGDYRTGAKGEKSE
jgi:enoyl-CoA hydratase